MAEIRSIGEHRRPEHSRGAGSREHASPWKLGGLSARQLARRLWDQMGAEEDDVFGRSAALAYYFFLAVFPLLLFFLTVFGLVLGSYPGIQQKLMAYLATLMPGPASQLVNQTVQETALHAAGWLLVVGIVGALWSGSGGFASLMTALNFVYDVKESRPIWKTRAIALALTIVVGLLMLVAILVTVIGGWVATHVGSAIGLGAPMNMLWRIGQYVVALSFVVLAFAVLYRWGPDRREHRWEWLTPGAFIGVLLWVGASIGLRVYLHFFDSYSKSYGSLGAVVILMLWFYVTALAMLVGAEINAEIEHAAAQQGRADAQLKGEKRA